MKSTSIVCLLTSIAILAGCRADGVGTDRSVAETASALDVLAVGDADVAFFRIDVAASSGDIVASQLVASTSSPDGHPSGQALLPVRAGSYTVTATPMREPDVPTPDCTPASAPATVARGKTTDLTLVARCTSPRGGIGVGAGVDFAPSITAVSFAPSRTVLPCQRLTVGVEASDPEGEAVSITFAVTAAPPGAPAGSYALDAGGNHVTFSATVPGDYTLAIGACDPAGCATLDAPLHVADDGSGGACASGCDDGNPCTDDASRPDGTCGHARVADGTLCTGGNLRVKLLGLNDFHGQLEEGRRVGTRPVGGAAILASYLEAAQAGIADQTIIVHAGDHIGASPPASALLQDEPSISFLNLLANSACSYANKLDPACNIVGTLGNHEFDEGRAELLRMLNGGNFIGGPFLEDPYRGARFPYVSANVVDQVSGDPLLPPYVVKRIHGVPIGFVGAVLEATPTIVTPTGVASLRFLDEADAINAQVPALVAQGVRSIVVTIHQGGFQSSYAGATNPAARLSSGPEIQDIVSRLDDEVDVVVSGHTHAFSNLLMPNAHGKQILVVQAFSSGTAYDDVNLQIDPVTRDVVAKSAQIVTTFGDAGPGLLPDPMVAAIVSAASTRVAPLVSRVVGTATGPFTRGENAAGESTLGDLIADAQRAAMGTQFAFMNPGGIRNDLDAGEITWGELFAIQPFGNTLVRMNLTGAQIYQVLEQQWLGQTAPRIMKISGFDYTWDPALPIGSRVVEVRLAGVAIDRAATYSITCNNFMATGGDNFTTFIAGTDQIGGPIDLDALIDYVEAQTPVGPGPGGRIRNP